MKENYCIQSSTRLDLRSNRLSRSNWIPEELVAGHEWLSRLVPRFLLVLIVASPERDPLQQLSFLSPALLQIHQVYTPITPRPDQWTVRMRRCFRRPLQLYGPAIDDEIGIPRRLLANSSLGSVFGAIDRPHSSATLNPVSYTFNRKWMKSPGARC